MVRRRLFVKRSNPFYVKKAKPFFLLCQTRTLTTSRQHLFSWGLQLKQQKTYFKNKTCCKQVALKSDSSIPFFCRKLSGKMMPMWCHLTCSWKKWDVVYFGKLFRVRGSALLGEREGDKKASNPCPTFTTACKVASHQCHFAWQLSAKNSCILLWY